MPDDVRTAIEEGAQKPKRAAGDIGSVRAHPLKDQIEADRYLSGKTAAETRQRGLRFNKLSPPGGTGE